MKKSKFLNLTLSCVVLLGILWHISARDITVSGVVLGGTSGAVGASVALSVGSNTASATTDSYGDFSVTMSVSNLSVTINCVVKMVGYMDKSVSRRISDEVDFGQIILEKSSNSIEKNTLSIKTLKKANNVQVYSLKGRLLYSGIESGWNKSIDSKLLLSQPYIVRFRFNKNTLYSEKRLGIK